MNRRDFIKTSAIVGAGVAFYELGAPERALAFAQSSGLGLTLFSQALRGGNVLSLATQIGVAGSDGIAATGATHYTINMRQFTDTLHGALGPTMLWGFVPNNYFVAGPASPRHLGGIIVAQKGQPIQITFQNQLPTSNNPWGQIHTMPVDTSIPGANQAQNRNAIHLHGGHVPWISDGGPFDWFAPNGTHGTSFLNNVIPGAPGGPGQAEYYYLNDQSARFMWYHDHAFGITRINAYAGIASGYIIRDLFEAGLRNQGLPDYIENGGREIPLVFQDKIFVGPSIFTVDPTWPGPSGVGSLWYAHVYDLTRWGPLGPTPAGAPPDPSAIPEYFGDTMLVNGTVYPEVTVEARRYRLRLLNACNARFLNLQMFVDDGSPDGITLSSSGNPTNQPFKNAAAPTPSGNATPNFLVIGTEGGFLPAPTFVPSNVPFSTSAISGSLIVAPAERPDLIVDFAGYAGKNIILYNDAPAPFPVGDFRNDYFPGLNNKNPVNATTPPGQGPNTRVLMRFKVMAATSADAPLTITPATNLAAGNDPLLVPLGVTTPPPGVPVRSLTLNEDFDVHGRLIQRLGTNVALYSPSFGRFYLDPTTENPINGTTEVWQIANLTGDTHPIHFHLVNVQVISRQAFNSKRYNGVPILNGPAAPPPPEESGWKETVRMNPGEVTTVIMKFNLPTVPFAVPSSPRTGGNEYVWHCHILEHEEHDMMRPLVVT